MAPCDCVACMRHLEGEPMVTVWVVCGILIGTNSEWKAVVPGERGLRDPGFFFCKRDAEDFIIRDSDLINAIFENVVVQWYHIPVPVET